MEDEIHTSLIPMANVVEDVERNEVPDKKTEVEIDGAEKEEEVEKEEEKEEEEITLEGGFIQVEKESSNVKDCNHNAETKSFADKRPTVVEHTDWNPDATRELLEAQEMVKELEDELVTISGLLKDSEFENINLTKELLLSKKHYQESVEKHDKICLEHERMREHISETKVRHDLDIKSMQGALKAQELKTRELTDVKKAFECLSLDLRTSRKDMEDLKLDLEISIDEAGRFEELHRQSSLLAASETKKAFELESLLKLAKSSAIEMQNQMVTLQDELKILYENIAENHKVEKMLKRTTAELSTVRGELKLSQSEVQDLNWRLASKEVLISELTQQLALASVVELKAKEDISSLENLMSSTKGSVQEVVSHLEDVKLKLEEKESYAKQLEECLKSHETKTKIMQEELAKSNIKKAELKDVVTDRTSSIAQIKEFYDDLEDKLLQSDDKFRETDSLFYQAMANRKELEQKLKMVKVVAIEEKDISGKEMEELRQRFTSEGQMLKSQISVVLEENSLLHEKYKSSKKDLHTVIEHLKEHLREQKSNKYASNARMDSLCTESNQKSIRASSANTLFHGTKVSQMTTLKFIFSVALVSVVIRIILGKKY